MAPRVAVVGVFHETNTFSPQPTGRAEFAARWLVADRLGAAFRRTRTVVGGLLDGATAHHLVAVPVFGTYATPAGLVTAEALDAIMRELRRSLVRRGPFDGVLVELHGAMAAEGTDDPEEEILALIREAASGVPVVCVLDLHANMGRARLERADILVGYRTNPHVDTYERGRAAAGHLAEVLAGRLRPVRVHRAVPLIAAPVAQRTDVEPLAALIAHARQREAAEHLVDVTVHAGYAYADVPHLGLGISVTADRSHGEGAGRVAGRVADELSALAWRHRERFRRDLPTAAEAFADAVRDAGTPGPVAVADTGDNINGGAPGDGTWLLAQALAHPEVATLTTLWDPRAVAAAVRAGPGARLELSLGGRTTTDQGAALPVAATVLAVTEGRFVNRGPMATGATVSMGTVAVLRIGRCDVVVQQSPVQPNDPGLFRCVGLEPASYTVVVLKGAAAPRAGWSGLATRFVDAGTPGVTDSRVERLALTRAPRGLWPLQSAGERGVDGHGT
jgi:microcystin degradation protein MlrC